MSSIIIFQALEVIAVIAVAAVLLKRLPSNQPVRDGGELLGDNLSDYREYGQYCEDCGHYFDLGETHCTGCGAPVITFDQFIQDQLAN